MDVHREAGAHGEAGAHAAGAEAPDGGASAVGEVAADASGAAEAVADGGSTSAEVEEVGEHRQRAVPANRRLARSQRTGRSHPG